LIALILFLFYLAVAYRSLSVLPLFRHSGLSQRGLSVLFSIKLVFGIALLLVYTFYYTDRGAADIYKYYDDAEEICAHMSTHPGATFKVITALGYDSADADIRYVLANTHHFDKKDGGFLESNHHLIIRANAILHFFSYGSIYIHTLIFCFLSFIGAVALYRALLPFFEEGSGRILVIPVFMIPSVLFWSSGLLKETLVMLCLGTLIFAAMKVLEARNLIANIILTALSLHFLYLTKPFLAISFVISFYLMVTFFFKGYIRIISTLIATLVVIWFLYAHHTFICEILESVISKRNEFVALGLKKGAHSLLDETIYPVTCTQPLMLLPGGMYNMFMQPFIWSHGLFDKLSGLENLLVLAFTAVLFFFFKRPRRTKLQLAVFCLSFFLLNYALIGVTVPIVGALVRYKVFGLMFYITLILTCIDLDKFISTIKNIKVLNFILPKTIFFLFR